MKELVIVLAVLAVLAVAAVIVYAQLPWCVECVAECVNETGAPAYLCEQVCADVCQVPVEYVVWLPVVGR